MRLSEKLEGLREDDFFCRDYPLLGCSCLEGPQSFNRWVGTSSSDSVPHERLGFLQGYIGGFLSVVDVGAEI